MILGGAQENTLLTLEGLRRDTPWEVHLAYGPETGEEGSLVDAARALGVVLCPLRFMRRNLHPLDDARSYFELKKLFRRERYDLVHTHSSKAGVLGRVAARRAGDTWLRVVSSRLANWVRNRLSGETITDAGCNFRVFKRECVDDLKFFKGMHRFLPTLLKIEGYTVTEVPISNHPRFSGQSNYGVWNRLFATSFDLLAVRWMKKRMFKFKVAERIN